MSDALDDFFQLTPSLSGYGFNVSSLRFFLFLTSLFFFLCMCRSRLQSKVSSFLGSRSSLFSLDFEPTHEVPRFPCFFHFYGRGLCSRTLGFTFLNRPSWSFFIMLFECPSMRFSALCVRFPTWPTFGKTFLCALRLACPHMRSSSRSFSLSS